MFSKLPEKDKTSCSLAVPFSITLLKKCVRYRIDSALIKHLHFFDLQLLLIQFEIQDIEDYLRNKEKKKLRSRGVAEVKNISGAEAIKFLGR